MLLPPENKFVVLRDIENSCTLLTPIIIVLVFHLNLFVQTSLFENEHTRIFMAPWMGFIFSVKAMIDTITKKS